MMDWLRASASDLRPQQHCALLLDARGGAHPSRMLACDAPDGQGFVVPHVRPVE